MKSEGIRFVITQAQTIYGDLDPNGIQNLKNAKQAGLYSDVYFNPCRQKDADPQVEASLSYYDSNGLEGIDQELPPKTQESVESGSEEGFHNHKAIILEKRLLQENKNENVQSADTHEPKETLGQLYRSIWIVVARSASQRCSWLNFTSTDNCIYLQGLIKAFQSRGKSVGIQSSHGNWLSLFKYAQNCDQQKDLPLWYIQFNGVANFDDWPLHNFGGWPEPNLKYYSHNNDVCGTKVGMNFY